MGGARGTYGGAERGIQGFCVEPGGGDRTLGRLMRIWEDNIKMDLQEAGWGLGLD